MIVGDELKSHAMPNHLPHYIWMQNFMPAQGYYYKRNIFFIDTQAAMILEHDKQELVEANQDTAPPAGAPTAVRPTLTPLLPHNNHAILKHTIMD